MLAPMIEVGLDIKKFVEVKDVAGEIWEANEEKRGKEMRSAVNLQDKKNVKR